MECDNKDCPACRLRTLLEELLEGCGDFDVLEVLVSAVLYEVQADPEMRIH
jgi:hypothetical protein